MASLAVHVLLSLGKAVSQCVRVSVSDFVEKKKKRLTPPSPTFQAEAGTLVRVTADITTAS